MSTSETIKTIDGAFEWFEKNVARVDDQDNKDAKAVHPYIHKAVCAAMPVLAHFLSGSYGRRVQAVKLKDIDIILVLDDAHGTHWASAKDTLVEVQDALRECALVRQARPPSVRSVKAFLHDYEFHVDIVPAIRPQIGDGLYLTRNLPDEGLNAEPRRRRRQRRRAGHHASVERRRVRVRSRLRELAHVEAGASVVHAPLRRGSGGHGLNEHREPEVEVSEVERRLAGRDVPHR